MSSADPTVLLARQRIIKASADLEVELSERSGGGPTIEILRRLREAAAESLAALVYLDVHDPKDRIKITTMQNEVKRYDEWVAWLRAIIAEGVAYDREMRDAERDEMLDLLAQQPDGERQAIELGLIDGAPQD
jgi:hypothetical protein